MSNDHSLIRSLPNEIVNGLLKDYSKTTQMEGYELIQKLICLADKKETPECISYVSVNAIYNALLLFYSFGMSQGGIARDNLLCRENVAEMKNILADLVDEAIYAVESANEELQSVKD